MQRTDHTETNQMSLTSLRPLRRCVVATTTIALAIAALAAVAASPASAEIEVTNPGATSMKVVTGRIQFGAAVHPPVVSGTPTNDFALRNSSGMSDTGSPVPLTSTPTGALTGDGTEIGLTLTNTGTIQLSADPSDTVVTASVTYLTASGQLGPSDPASLTVNTTLRTRFLAAPSGGGSLTTCEIQAGAITLHGDYVESTGAFTVTTSLPSTTTISTISGTPAICNHAGTALALTASASNTVELSGKFTPPIHARALCAEGQTRQDDGSCAAPPATVPNPGPPTTTEIKKVAAPPGKLKLCAGASCASVAVANKKKKRSVALSAQCQAGTECNGEAVIKATSGKPFLYKGKASAEFRTNVNLKPGAKTTISVPLAGKAGKKRKVISASCGLSAAGAASAAKLSQLWIVS